MPRRCKPENFKNKEAPSWLQHEGCQCADVFLSREVVIGMRSLKGRLYQKMKGMSFFVCFMYSSYPAT